jgi:DNA-binding LacI/PurR family transcriptional regulator
MLKSTIKDIACVAGISDTTVSLAFQANSRISGHTRAYVLSSTAS